MRAQPQGSHFIDGAHVEDTAGAAFDVLHPATGEVIARLHDATPAIVARAVEAAARVQADWAALAPVARGRILRRAADLVRAHNDRIARLESLDTGRAIQETAVVDAATVADALEFLGGAVPAFAGEAHDFGGPWGYTRREPLGVCAGIGAWNYPFQGAGWKSAPALAMGNAMVFKPSENAPLSALMLAEIYKEAGLPDGLFNVIQGRGAVGAALVEHPRIAKVTFTGSVPTGRKVMGLAGSLMKKGTMELGGKSPLVIFADADPDNAVGGALMANFYSTGQVCTNGTRVYVDRAIHDDFVARAVERTRNIRIGDPFDPATQMGPMINRETLDKVRDYIRIGLAEGATLACGGGMPPMQGLQGMEGGFWIEPAIFTGATDDMRIAREEIFGPVMTVLPFDSEDEVIARANDTEFGLSAGVFTADLARGHRVARAFQAGTCWINNYNLTPVEIPFGGNKASGIGRENGLAALEAFSQVKSIYVEDGPVVASF